MDFVLAILPWPVVMGLNMKRKEKTTIACGLSLGVFAGACSVVRTVELRTLSSRANYVHDTSPMLLWSSSEICLSIVCACIPVLRPLYVRVAYGSRADSSAPSNTHSFPPTEFELSHSRKASAANTCFGKSSKRSRVYVGPGASALHTTVKMGSGNASEESILRECDKYAAPERAGGEETPTRMPPSKNDIRVTTTVEVEENVGEKFVV